MKAATCSRQERRFMKDWSLHVRERSSWEIPSVRLLCFCLVSLLFSPIRNGWAGGVICLPLACVVTVN